MHFFQLRKITEDIIFETKKVSKKAEK